MRRFVSLNFVGNIIAALVIFSLPHRREIYDSLNIGARAGSAETLDSHSGSALSEKVDLKPDAPDRAHLTIDNRTGMLSDSVGNLWFEVPVEWLVPTNSMIRPTRTNSTTVTNEVASGLFLTADERRTVDSALSAATARITRLEKSIALRSLDDAGNTVITFPPWGDIGNDITSDMEATLTTVIGKDRAMVLSRMLQDGEWFMLRDGNTAFRIHMERGKQTADIARDGKIIIVVLDNDDSIRMRFAHIFHLDE